MKNQFICSSKQGFSYPVFHLGEGFKNLVPDVYFDKNDRE